MNFKRTAARLTAAVLLVSSLVTPAFALTGTVTTDNSVLRLRSEPSTDGSILKKLANGTKVEVLDALSEGWYEVSCEGTTGYVSDEYVTLDWGESDTKPAVVVGENKSADAEQPAYVKVVEGPLNIRSGAGTEFDKVGSLSTGRVVEVLGAENGWYKIEAGYICGDYVVETDKAQAQSSGLAQQVVDYALQFVGYPYVYGGSSPRGFDCSGFTSYVYKHFGYNINRTASAQLNNGVAVSRSELQPGDLVMFRKNTSKPASHVGLYIGNGQFVHACTSRVGVIVSSLSSNYYSTGFIGGRRIIN